MLQLTPDAGNREDKLISTELTLDIGKKLQSMPMQITIDLSIVSKLNVVVLTVLSFAHGQFLWPLLFMKPGTIVAVMPARSGGDIRSLSVLGEKENILATVTPSTEMLCGLWVGKPVAKKPLFVKVDGYTDAVLVGLLDEFQALKEAITVKVQVDFNELARCTSGLLLLSNFTRTISAGFVCVFGTVVWIKSS